MAAVVGEVIFAGLLFGAAFAVLLLLTAWLQRSLLAATMAVLMLIGALAAALIMVSWRVSPGAGETLELVELALIMAVGPMTLIFVGSLLRSWVPVKLVAGLGLAGFAGLALLEMRYGGDPVIYSVPAHAACTLWGWILLLRSKSAVRRSRAYRQRRLAFGLLAAVSIVNLASLTRLFFPGVGILRGLVPTTIGSLFVMLLLAALWIFLRRHAPALARRSDSASEQSLLAGQAAELIERQQLFLQPDLKPELVARLLDVPATRLARALADSDWGSFAALVQHLRLEQAKRMLADDSERATSIEAVGLLCGFRSRSAFYQAFRRYAGSNPGEYRKKALSLS